MDEQLKYQITGAVIWFVLTAWVVGDWYAHPVNFTPEGETASASLQKAPVIKQPLKIPVQVKQLPDGAQQHTPLQPKVAQQVVSQAGVSAQQQGKPKANAPQTAPQASAAPKRYLVKVASYEDEVIANKLSSALNEQGYKAWYKPFTLKDGRVVYSVRIGPVDGYAQAEAIKQKVDRHWRTRSIIEAIKTEKK